MEFLSVCFIPHFVPRLIVAKKWMSDTCQMCPDLMGLAGEKLYFQQCLVMLCPDWSVPGLDIRIIRPIGRAICKGGGYGDLIVFCIFSQETFDKLIFLYNAFDIHLIVFVKGSVF